MWKIVFKYYVFYFGYYVKIVSLIIDQIKEGCLYQNVVLNFKSIFVFIVLYFGGYSFKRKKKSSVYGLKKIIINEYYMYI